MIVLFLIHRPMRVERYCVIETNKKHAHEPNKKQTHKQGSWTRLREERIEDERGKPLPTCLLGS